MFSASPRPVPEFHGQTVSSAIYRSLRTEIVSLRRKPREQVRSATIATSFRVSPTPVYEALMRLANDGLVEIVPSSGTFVTRVPLADLPTALEICRVLERETARFAAGRASPGHLGRLTASLERYRELGGSADGDAFCRAEEEFHALLAEAAGYPLFWTVGQRVKWQVDRCRQMALAEPDAAASLLADHQAIVEAIAAHDPASAAAAVDRQFQGIEAGVRRMLERHPDYFLPP